ncbi:hypothetical protein PG984_006628 [Apiospora sp. TS-2023a]
MRLQARNCQIGTSAAFLVGVSVLSLSGFAGAVCTEWNQEGTSQEDMTHGYSGDHEIALEQIACPADAAAPCPFEEGSPHRIVVTPDMWAHTHGIERLTLSSDEETAAILQLAQDGFRAQASDDSDSAPVAKFTFQTLEETVYPFRNVRHADHDRAGGEPQRTVPYTDSDRMVEPGSSAKLKWKSFWRTSTGILGGCTNNTLDGLRVIVGGPYLTMNEYTNSTSIAGTWSKGKASAAGPSDKRNGATSLKKGSLGGVILGCSVAVVVSSFMI